MYDNISLCACVMEMWLVRLSVRLVRLSVRLVRLSVRLVLIVVIFTVKPVFKGHLRESVQATYHIP